MSRTFSIGLIGARGYTGRELLKLIAGHPSFALAFASSRELAGTPVSDMAPEIAGVDFEALSPEDAAARKPDACVLALPDGAGAAFVAAFESASPETVLVDLSADYRFDDDWAYGLPELYRQREGLAGAKRIANPGCYATAAQLALHPVNQIIEDYPCVFGVSGYSGAGTTPSRKNDTEALADNLMPYALSGHKHEREVTRQLRRPIAFTPHVHPAFSGILVTVHARLRQPVSLDAVKAFYEEAYAHEPLVKVQDPAPELKDGTGIQGAIIGGLTVVEDQRRLVVLCAEDNLLKGAAVQAVQNLNLALGLDELAGIPVSS